MKLKKFIALATVATMVMANTITAFADDGVTGTGAVEYDDSTAIKYDQVQVPTLVAGTYNFAMDPQGLMNTAGYTTSSDYVAGKTVYFKTQNTAAKVVAKENGLMYTKGYTARVDAVDGVFQNLATGTITDGVATVTAVTARQYLWVPDKEYAGGSGSSGKYIEVTKDNIEDYFTLTTGDTGKLHAEFRPDYKAGEDVCNGVLYNMSGVVFGGSSSSAKATLENTDATPLSDYFTIADDAITEVTGIYSDNTCETAVAANAFDYTAATTHYTNQTDNVYVKNLSTKSKTVTAKVTLKNADGLTISGTEGFTGITDKAAIYVGAYGDGTAEGGLKVLAKAADSDEISATVTATLAGANEDSSITYQTEEKNSLGGHKYARYEAPGITYTSNTFYIKAAAASQTNDNKEAWAKYFEDATAAPSLNIVYTVKNTNAEDDEDEETPEVTPTVGTAKVTTSDGVNYLALRGADNARFEVAATSIKVNDIDVTAKGTLIAGYVAVSVS